MVRRWQKWIPFLCIFLVSHSVLLGFSDTAEKARQLNREIVLLNLINGLYLTPEQMQTLVEMVETAEEVRSTFLLELDQNKSVFEDVLTEVRNVLIRGEGIPQDLKKRIHKMKALQHRLEDERGEKLVQLESELLNLLTDNQLLVIEDYKPCTIPPAQGKIGQSVDAAARGIVRIFDRIRHMPKERYDDIKETIVDMHMDKIERHLGFENAKEREDYRKKILKILNRVRKLSDKKFLLKKSELAQALLPENIKTHKLRKNELGKTGRLLLDPALVPILKSRLQQG